MRTAILAASALVLAACAAAVAPEGAGDTAAHHYALGAKLLPRGEIDRAAAAV